VPVWRKRQSGRKNGQAISTAREDFDRRARQNQGRTAVFVAASIGTAISFDTLAAMIAGDAVLYHPVQSASSLAVYQRGYLTARKVFGFSVRMTLITFAVVLPVAPPCSGTSRGPLSYP
jgi:nitrate reductase alpha subunit